MDTEEVRVCFSFLPDSIRFNLVLFLLLFALTSTAGQFQVIGSLQPVVAAPGDDVILPCHVEPQLDVGDLTVEWSKPDFRPDPNDRLRRVKYVHLYRDNREVPDMKISSFLRRTMLFSDRLTEGNISLKITNVSHVDEGPYKCFIPKLKGHKHSVVHLLVDQNFNKPTATDTPLHPKNLQTPEPTEETDLKGVLTHPSRLVPLVLSCVFMIMSFGVGGYFYFVHKCQKTEDAPIWLH